MENNKPRREMKFNYGGQAVIEGVMMRGANAAAVAVRNPKGEIVVHETPLSRTLYRGRIIKTPFVRGVIGLWDALGLGTRALMWAADVAVGEDEEVDFNGPIGWATIGFSLLLGIGLFFLLPTLGAAGIGNLLGLTPDGSAPVGFAAFLVNLIEGTIQLSLLVAYIWAIGRIPDVKRLFGYHGAEHKTINAYEAGADLKPEIVAQYPIEHPRCGTAFLLTVAFVSVFVFSLLGRPPLPLLILSRVILIPVIAGIAYEVIQFSARNMHRPLVRLLVKPNLALQHLTTRPPDLHMIEVAIVAFERVLVSEGILSAEEAVIPEPRPEAVSPTLAATGD
ncbi:MAG TPA: DUF1385 domain-containing protein [Spirillospora sp.]|nr:DUF1385 domain-containing protein [Spirillospora sp.]